MAGQLALSLLLKADATGLQRGVGEGKAALDQMQAAARSTATALTPGLSGNADRAAVALNRLPAISGQLRNQLQLLSFQINDVVTGLASGQRPFAVLAQQGGQIAQIFGPMASLLGVAAIAAVGLGRAFLDLGGDADAADRATRALDDAQQALKDTMGGAARSADELAESYARLGQELAGVERLAIARAVRLNQEAIQANIKAVGQAINTELLKQAEGAQSRAFGEAILGGTRFGERIEQQIGLIDQLRQALARIEEGAPAQEVVGVLGNIMRDFDLATDQLKASIQDLAIRGKDAIELQRQRERLEAQLAILEGRATPAQRAVIGEARAPRAPAAARPAAARAPDEAALTAAQAARYRVAEQAARDLAEALREQERAEREIERIRRAYLTPTEALAEREAELVELRRQGLDAVTFERALAAAREEAAAKTERLAEAELARRRDAAAGVERALKGYVDQATDMAGQVEQAITAGFANAEDALVKFATTGKLEFASLANAIIADLARIAIRAAILGPIASALGGALAGAFGGGASAGVAATPGGPSQRFAEGGLVPFLSGAAVGRDSILAALTPGEFVVRPEPARQFRPMLEAINDGRLERFARGGMVGGGAAVAGLGGPQVEIHNHPAPGQRIDTTISQGADGRLIVKNMVRQAYEELAAEGRLDRANRRWGLRPQPLR